MYFLLIPLFLYFIIGTHEASRYYTAKLLGIKNIRVTIGVGLRLFTIINKDTQITVRLLPITGETVCRDADYYQLKLWHKYLYELSGYTVNFITLTGPLFISPYLFTVYMNILNSLLGFLTTGDPSMIGAMQSVSTVGMSSFTSLPDPVIIYLLLLTIHLLIHTLPLPPSDFGRLLKTTACSFLKPHR